MSTTSGHGTVEELIEQAVKRERARNVGLVLSAYGVCKLAGNEQAAEVLDALATRMETNDRPYREAGEEG